MEQELHFEHGDLTGEVSVTLKQDCTLNDLAAKYIHEYNRDRFEAVTIRVFVGKETIVTLYAVDKMRAEHSSLAEDKIAVKKFKIPGIPLHELSTFIESMNCTLTTNAHPLETMQVINK